MPVAVDVAGDLDTRHILRRHVVDGRRGQQRPARPAVRIQPLDVTPTEHQQAIPVGGFQHVDEDHVVIDGRRMNRRPAVVAEGVYRHPPLAILAAVREHDETLHGVTGQVALQENAVGVPDVEQEAVVGQFGRGRRPEQRHG